MTTTITKRIGTQAYHRDYPTLLAALNAMPLNLVASDQCWILELYNDSAFNIYSDLLITGFTTDASHTITIRPASGHGFRDSAVASTPLYANQALGVVLNQTGSSNYGFLRALQANLFLDGLQIVASGSDGGHPTVTVSNDNPVITNCLIQSSGSTVLSSTATNASLSTNNLFIQLSAYGHGCVDNASAGYKSSTFVAPNGSTGQGLIANYSAPLLVNCAAFGFSGRALPSQVAAGTDYNVSDGTSPGSHSKSNKVLANQFVSATDFRVKAGSDLIGAGTVTSQTTDLLRQARNSSAPTVGSYEYGSTIPANSGKPADPAPPTMHVSGTFLYNGSPVASATNLRWAWYDDPASQPTDYGIGSTDASGHYSFLLVSTLVGIGGSGFLRVTDSVGTANSTKARSFFGKKTVTS